MANYLAEIAVFVAVFLVLAASLNLILGYGGVFSLVHAAFYGIGAYIAAQMVIHLHAPFPLELLGAFVGTAVLGAAGSFLLMNLDEHYVIIGTLALQLILSNVFEQWNGATGGSYGIFGIAKPALFGQTFASVTSYAAFAGAVALICYGFTVWLGRSSFGLTLRAQRDDKVLASALGCDPARMKLLVFALGAGLAGIAGGVYAQFVGYIDPSTFNISQSLSIITIVVVGGLANLWGTLGAAVVLTVLPQLLNLIPGTSDVVAQVQLLLYGLILLLIVRFWPHGLIPEQPNVRARSARARGARARGPSSAAGAAVAAGPALGAASLAASADGMALSPGADPAGDRPGAPARAAVPAPGRSGAPAAVPPGAAAGNGAPEAGDVVLGRVAEIEVAPVARPAAPVEVQGLGRSFGGIRAVDGVDLRIEPNRVTALIGPNGAGKTTLFNLICGHLRADTGRVRLGGQDITALPSFTIARQGVTRTFQDVRIFHRLTVLENLVFAMEAGAEPGDGPSAPASGGAAGAGTAAAGRGSAPSRAMAILEQFGLEPFADVPAGQMSYAQQKLLMMAVVIGRGDPVVFLDELAAGLDHNSVRSFAALVRRIAASGRTVCLVEHNLPFVWECADTVLVLNEGQLIASGAPAEIQANRQVGEIYFGRAEQSARP